LANPSKKLKQLGDRARRSISARENSRGTRVFDWLQIINQKSEIKNSSASPFRLNYRAAIDNL
jgi:hypothetical protein